MPRRSIDRSNPMTGNIIDLKTGKPVEKNSIPAICERIRYYRERKDIEQKALAAMIGVTKNAVSNWETGRSRPDINLLPDICSALDVSLYDLFDMKYPGIEYNAGEQLHMERFNGLTPGHKAAVDQLIDTLIDVQEAEKRPAIRKLIYFERSLAAGIGDPTEFEEEGTPIYLYASREVDRADYVFSVNGDSMEPKYHSGDMVLVSKIPDAPDLQYGEIGAFIIGNETYIKVYREEGLESLNPKYPLMRFVDTDSVYLIGRVTGVVGQEQITSEEDIRRYQILES